MRLYKKEHIEEDEFLEFIKELTKDEINSSTKQKLRNNLETLISSSPITWKVDDILFNSSNDNNLKC